MIERILTWEEIHIAATRLAEQVRARPNPPDVIVGISRGGLIPATLVAHSLGIRHIEIVNASFYDAKKKRSSVTASTRYRPDGLVRVLVVDDLVDSGTTMRETIRKLGGPGSIKSAVLYHKDGASLKCDFSSVAVPRDTWLVFPWELSSAEETA